MNKTLVTIGVIGGGLLAGWYFLVPPMITITQIDQLGKKIKFTYGGTEHVFDYSNPAMAMGLPTTRGFSTIVKVLPGTQPYITFDISRGGKMVGQKQIDLNKSVTLAQ